MSRKNTSFRLRLLALGALILVASGAPSQTVPFSFETVIARAEQLAAAPYVDPSRTIPQPWLRLGYDDYRKITYRNKRALWKGEGLFEIEFFHPGFFYDYPVGINIVTPEGATPFPYQPELFDFGDLDTAALGTDEIRGYAGFRVNFPLNSHHGHEFAVFQGASYFRIVGRDQRYGQSARGLAIDTAAPGGEEFPIYREFWIERPDAEATTLVIYALLDSHSVAGAYRMIVRPGNETRAEVTAVLFPRRDIAKVGIAPLTSMFFYGEDHTRVIDDFRPEVHDSDGLMLHTGGGEWLWRPLVNRTRLTISSFLDNNPRGFGLVQRDLDFTNYQDLEAQYHRRSSVWVQPTSDFGRGRIELVEIPSDQETNDNIVAYFVPERPVVAGQRLEYSYVLTAFLDAAAWPPAGRVEATRIGGASHAAQQQPSDGRLFVLDFNRGELPLLSEAQPLKAVVDVSRGRISPPVVLKNHVTKGWRVFFYFYPDDAESAEFRAYLKVHDRVLTETWNYLWQNH
ncbi:MAG: glucan biosynthesis protein [Gammaproteobacteria bacterium]|nr:glucan biosynthesis protein [Gammaproteobacteria bacterium]